MKGILAKGLLVVCVLTTTAIAQTIPTGIPIWDEDYLAFRGASLRFTFPISRDFNGGGARAKGMGNAFLGISDDVSAVSWNPAGLYRHDEAYEQPVMALGYQSLSSDAAFKDRFYPSLPWSEFNYNENFSGLNFLSLLVPLRIKGHVFVGSIAYNRLGDEFYNAGTAIDTVMPFDAQDYLDGIFRPFSYVNTNTYRSWINATNIGFGTRLYSHLSFGIAVNAYGGKAAQETIETLEWEGLIIPGMEGNQRGKGALVNHVIDTTSFSGVYFTIGLKYTTEKVSGGLVVKTPHTLKESLDVLSISKGYVNGVEATGVGATVHSDDNIVELDQPFIIGGGLGYNVAQNWLLAADFEYRAFASGMVRVRDSLLLVPGGTDIEFFRELDPYWNNALTIRLGTEYVWNTGSRFFPEVPLRAGFGYIQVPQPDVVGGTLELVNGVPTLIPITERASMTRYSFGAGVRWAQIRLDMAYEMYSADFKNTFIEQESSTDNGAFNFTFTGYF